jgi:hypothetical protein
MRIKKLASGGEEKRGGSNERQEGIGSPQRTEGILVLPIKKQYSYSSGDAAVEMGLQKKKLGRIEIRNFDVDTLTR